MPLGTEGQQFKKRALVASIGAGQPPKTMASNAARPEWSAAPYKPKVGVQVNPVARKPHRRAVDGCVTGATSVESLIAQERVPAAAADGWMKIGASGGHRYGDAQRDSGGRPFFAEVVADTRPRSLREALDRKARDRSAATGCAAGESTQSKHLRSASARHQREQLRRAAPGSAAPDGGDVRRRLGAMERTPPGRILAWGEDLAPAPPKRASARNAETVSSYWDDDRSGPRTVYATTPADRVLSWPEATDAAAVRARNPTGTFVPLRARQNRPPPREEPSFRAAHNANVAERTALADRLGAVTRTPPGRVIGWTPA